MASPLDIYGDEALLVPKDRAFRIEIDNVYGSPNSKKTIKYHQETLILQGEDGAEVGKAHHSPATISLDFNDVFMKTYTFTDPVTGVETTLSLAGLALAINMDYVARRTYQAAVDDLKAQLEAGTITEDEYNVQVAALPTP